MDTVWIALITATAAFMSPLLLVVLQGRGRRLDKAQDYARQDAVAARLMERQDRAAAAVATVAKNLDLNNRVIAEATVSTQTQLKEIHKLVNSNMTAEMKNNLDGLRRELVLLHHVVDLDHAADREPSVDVQAQIKSAEDKIAELQAAISDRLDPKEKE